MPQAEAQAASAAAPPSTPPTGKGRVSRRGLASAAVAVIAVGIIAVAVAVAVAVGNDTTPNSVLPTMPATTTTFRPGLQGAFEISITGCTVSPYLDTLITVTGTLVNQNTTGTASYLFEIVLSQGSTRVGTVTVSESSLSAGQTATWTTGGLIIRVNGGPVTCRPNLGRALS
jgi:hypothetical protein